MDRLEEYNIECMLINDNQAQEDELIKEYERNSMDRLISEQEIFKIIDSLKANFTCYDSVTLDEAYSHVKAIPSAYKGMTNGEVIKVVFPYGKYGTNGDYVHVYGVGGNGCLTFTKDWWNSPYEPQESEVMRNANGNN